MSFAYEYLCVLIYNLLLQLNIILGERLEEVIILVIREESVLIT